jgi:hypothetical protein
MVAAGGVSRRARGDIIMEKDRLQSTAASLYDGGWRSEDKQELMDEYDMPESDADRICELLEKYAD